MSSPIVDKILRRLETMSALRGTFESHWQEVADYVVPMKNNITVFKHPGEKRNLVLFDDTAPQALVLLSGALHGLLTNPTLQWFELTTGDAELDDQSDMRQFLGKTTTQMHNLLNSSNFQTMIHEVYQDLGSFGTAALAMMEDEEDTVRFLTKHISEYFIDENDKGIVDTVYCQFNWDIRQISQRFGLEKLPKDMQDKLLKQPDEKCEVIHAVFPVADMKEIRPLVSGGMDWASIWIIKKHRVIVKSGGFKEFPFAVPRWTKASGEMYGRSPSVQALPSIKLANQMWKTMIISAQKHADPALMVNSDSVISPVTTVPGGLVFVRPGLQDSPIKPLITGSRIDFTSQMIQDNRRQIREAYFIDQLQLNQGPQMTATEVRARTEEKMRLLGPVLGRMQSELLRPMIDRLFGIMLRRGLVDKESIPEELSGTKLDVQYKSLVARAQRISEADNILRAVEASTPFIQLDPSVMDNYDGDEAVRRIARLYSVPQEVIKNTEDRDAVRQQRQQQQAVAQERQVASEEANIGAVEAQTVTQLSNANG